MKTLDDLKGKVQKDVVECIKIFKHCTSEEIAAELGKTKRAVNQSIYEIRRICKGIRICRYLRQDGNSGMPSPVWAIGVSNDAPKPAPLTNKERTMRYYETHKVTEVVRAKMYRKRTGKTKESKPLKQATWIVL